MAKACPSRLWERKISQKEVIDVIIHGEQIEDYPDDKLYPSALIMGWQIDKPLHVVVALDIMNGLILLLCMNLHWMNLNLISRPACQSEAAGRPGGKNHEKIE